MTKIPAVNEWRKCRCIYVCNKCNEKIKQRSVSSVQVVVSCISTRVVITTSKGMGRENDTRLLKNNELIN